MSEISFQQEILMGIPEYLPDAYSPDPALSHAPIRNIQGVLTEKEKCLAIDIFILIYIRN